jgi:2-phosphoglycerate kinase
MILAGPQDLTHVLWIGGATDSGKSTLAIQLAGRHGLQVYHYDRRDLAHHEILAQTNPAYRSFLTASLGERWVFPEPEELFQRSLQSFRDRFPLLIEDLIALPRHPGIIVEGFGLLPELLAPLLSRPTQAVWLVPTPAFKQASMARRSKPSFASQTSDPERARANLLERDRLLTVFICEQVVSYGYTLYHIDGARSPDEMVKLLEQSFHLSIVD